MKTKYRLLAVAALSLNLHTIQRAQAGSFATTGRLHTGRYNHSATLLPNGKVLVAGGGSYNSGGTISSAELYDPPTGTWTQTGSLTTPRGLHVAILLPDGKVLVVGGAAGPFLPGAELYDPASEKWAPTSGVGTFRNAGAATLLPDGRALISGGYDSLGVLSAVELYDPATGVWTARSPLTTPREFHSSTSLSNGKVLVAGNVRSTELYDSSPATVAAIQLANASKPPGGAFQFAFTNTRGMSFSVFGATNPSVALNQWIMLGGSMEISPGQYQFTDPSAANTPHRFYRVRSP